MIEYCPRCNRPFSRAKHSGDFVHVCNSGDSALDQEDKLVIGDWEDYTGSGTRPAAQVTRQGISNTQQGERSGNEGNRVSEYGDRGRNEQLYRTRQHEEYVE